MKGASKGYTLVELILAMLIFSVVMLILSVSFSKIVKSSGQLVKSAETDIGGLIGLEVMRSDLELAGFGLPYTVPGTVAPYIEAKDDLKLVFNCPDGCPDALPSKYDDRNHPDADSRKIPSPFRLGNNVGFNRSDYLVLKGTALGTSDVSRGWCYFNYSSGKTIVQAPPGEKDLLPGKSHRAIVLKSGVAGGASMRELVTDGATFTLRFDEPLPKEFSPRDKGDSYLVYGVDLKDPLQLNFPFNRVDYYISKPGGISSSCVNGTGVLYKSNITQGGGRAICPIIDCVADMQVVLFWDASGDGVADYHAETLEEVAKTPADLRGGLKELRVYILAQQGSMDPGYLHPVPNPERAILVGETLDGGTTLGRAWKASELAQTFGGKWRNYRWRLYTIVVQPRNL